MYSCNLKAHIKKYHRFTYFSSNQKQADKRLTPSRNPTKYEISSLGEKEKDRTIIYPFPIGISNIIDNDTKASNIGEGYFHVK